MKSIPDHTKPICKCKGSKCECASTAFHKYLDEERSGLPSFKGSLRPNYYRFVYSPSSGDVDLSHDHATHPARIPTHDDMAAHRVEKDLIYGFAHRIRGGWRITNDEHQALGDPHALNSVAQAVQDAER